ncbi:MAG: LPS export ABC transporter ATP-binding protein [Candidatus Calescibacterium sp.]|nr:LPS export ABC transporter ATP-binding protein [Candidatus Calescibacterium sp.]MCX7972289.1 LPS export ABC transporter ATP-binding protein [bacterium]MDW8195107.1 LPS export ABC transporter ATP-binding protein [Candidatus Calescibacterium sp.]
MNILRAEKLRKMYAKRAVVNSISLEIRQGEILGLLGPNGAGKTTTFYMLVGLTRPDSGKIFINDIEITLLPLHKKASYGISYLPQESSIFRGLTVEENFQLVLEYYHKDKNLIKQKIEELLEEFGLKHVRKNLGYTLSGGERRKVEIARTMIINPKFLLLDEPFSGVDPITIEQIQNIIYNLKQKNIGVVITDHNVYETLRIVDRAYIISNGEVIVQGTKEEIAQNELARKYYLGEKFRLLG